MTDFKSLTRLSTLPPTGSNLITAANFCLNGKFAAVGTYDGRCIFYETEVKKKNVESFRLKVFLTLTSLLSSF